MSLRGDWQSCYQIPLKEGIFLKAVLHSLKEKRNMFPTIYNSQFGASSLNSLNSFFLINEQIHNFAHVPQINFNSQLLVLRFNNVSLQITQLYSIQMTLTKDFIAINIHGQHAVFSQMELACYNKQECFMGNTTLSPHAKINHTCL